MQTGEPVPRDPLEEEEHHEGKTARERPGRAEVLQESPEHSPHHQGKDNGGHTPSWAEPVEGTEGRRGQERAALVTQAELAQKLDVPSAIVLDGSVELLLLLLGERPKPGLLSGGVEKGFGFARPRHLTPHRRDAQADLREREASRFGQAGSPMEGVPIRAAMTWPNRQGPLCRFIPSPMAAVGVAGIGPPR